IMSDGVATTSYAYDDGNRLLVAADALGNQTTFGYQQVSCGCSERDEIATIHTPDLPANKQWVFGYGFEGRLASVTDPDGYIESYGYEPAGELNSLIDRNGNPTTTTHDSFGRVSSILDALGRASARSYTKPNGGSMVGPTLTSASSTGTPPSTDIAAALNDGEYQIGENLYQAEGFPAQVSFYRDATFQLGYVKGWDDAKRMIGYRDRAALPISSTEVSNFTSNFFSESPIYNGHTTDPAVGMITSLGSKSSSFGYTPDFDVTGGTGFGQGGCSS